MSLIAAGISHQTAPVEERERLAIGPEELPDLLAHFRRLYGNGVVLSTCNRTEIYVHVHHNQGEVPPHELLEQLALWRGLDPATLPRSYSLQEAEVAAHLFRVAAGIDSMVLGEGQILGQVREAFSAAHSARTLDAVLARLLHEAVRTGKRARTETTIARYAVSVSSAAVSLAREQVLSLPECRALVVGAGEVGKLAARALRDQGVAQIVVTSRTPHRAQEAADFLSAETVPFEQLEDAVATADIVITSSSAPSFLIGVPLVRAALSRREMPITFLDVAVPRNVDPAIRELAGVFLFDIDDLQAVSEASLRRREEAAQEAGMITQAAADTFGDWLESQRAVPTIKALIEFADQVRQAETTRTIREMDLNPDDAERLDRMTAAIVKKLLHAPITHLRYADNSEDAAERVREVFQIEEP